MDPPVYFEPPPTYKENAQPATEKMKVDVETQTKESLSEVIAAVAFFIGMMLLVAAVTTLFANKSYEDYENKQHDRVRSYDRYDSGSRLFLDGNSSITVNGTKYMTSSGVEYQLILPSYNVHWPSERHAPEIFFYIHVEGEETLVKTKRDAHLCEGEGTWCLTIRSQEEIKSPIVVDYVVKFPKKGIHIPFSRTFHVEQWISRGKVPLSQIIVE